MIQSAVNTLCQRAFGGNRWYSNAGVSILAVFRPGNEAAVFLDAIRARVGRAKYRYIVSDTDTEGAMDTSNATIRLSAAKTRPPAGQEHKYALAGDVAAALADVAGEFAFGAFFDDAMSDPQSIALMIAIVAIAPNSQKAVLDWLEKELKNAVAKFENSKVERVCHDIDRSVPAGFQMLRLVIVAPRG